MLLNFLFKGAIITGGAIASSNILLAEQHLADEVVVKRAFYKAVRYGVIWPKVWADLLQQYQRGDEQWRRLFWP